MQAWITFSSQSLVHSHSLWSYWMGCWQVDGFSHWPSSGVRGEAWKFLPAHGTQQGSICQNTDRSKSPDESKTISRPITCIYYSFTHSWGKEGFRKGSESLPLTTLVLRCLGSDVEATEREGDAGLGGFLLASSFLWRSMSSLCWLMPSCCLHMAQRMNYSANTGAFFHPWITHTSNWRV